MTVDKAFRTEIEHLVLELNELIYKASRNGTTVEVNRKPYGDGLFVTFKDFHQS